METARNCRIAAPLVVIVALAGASAATAQNLLTNPEFDGFGTSGSTSDPFPGWDSRIVVPTAGEDVDACPDSDSHRQDSDSQSTGAIANPDPNDCVLVDPEETLHIEVAYRSSTPFEVRLLQSPNEDCTETPIPIPLPPPDIPASADWTTVRLQRTLAPTTHSVVLWLRGAGDGPYFLQLDRVYLGRAERIFADDFDGDAGGTFCRWDAVVDGLPL